MADKGELFLRLKDVTDRNVDHSGVRAYQVEALVLKGGKAIARELLDKPDLPEISYAKACELLNPTNQADLEHYLA